VTVPSIYHLVPPEVWERTGDGPYRADSLATEGFIHCSYGEQVGRVANLFYADRPELLVLTIDPDRLGSPVRAEDPGTGELFPHVYGPIERAAVREVRPLQRDAAGRWVF
jgi:uncharacterized protein (DUF952 family)